MFLRRNIAEVPTALTRIPVRPEDIYIEPGYRLAPLIIGLTFPTSLTFDDLGYLYIGESGYSYGPAVSNGQGRILRLSSLGRVDEVARGFRPPLTGLTWHDGYFYVAEGAYPGRILRVHPGGEIREVLVDNLPTGGDHMTGQIAFGPDGRLYFGVGTATNSGVVGLDNSSWLLVRPEFHDTPCRDIILRGNNYGTINIFKPYDPELVLTGGFKPFGVPAAAGEEIGGELKCNGVIYSMNPDGSDLRIYADGFRNPFGLGFSPDGNLYTIDQGYDLRGSRPVADSPDTLWRVLENGWYGWPDFVAGIPITDPRFASPGGEPLEFLLAEHPEIPVSPSHTFPHGEIAMKFDFSPGRRFGHRGDLFVAEFGGPAPHVFVKDGEDKLGIDEDYHYRGYRVVRIDLETGIVRDFIVNKKPGPRGTGIERPIAVKFSPGGDILYLLDFGVVQSNKAGWRSWANSGILWAVYPEG